MKRSSPLAFLALTGLLLTACGGSETPQANKDTTKPTVTLSAAPKSVVPGGAVTLTAAASDDIGVTKVSFYQGNTLISEDTAAPYEATTTVSGTASGTVTYRAVASDAAGNTAEATDTVSVLTGKGVIQGIVVDQNIGAPVAGSAITVMSGGKPFTSLTSGTDGTFTLSGLPAGTYDLQARKAGLAGFDLHGLIIADNTMQVRLIQRPAFETSATTDGAKLTLTRADGKTPLAGATFTDKVDFQATVTADSNHVGPVRVMYAQLGRTPGTAGVAGSSQDSKWTFSPVQDALTPPTSGAVTLPDAANPNFVKGFGSAAGEALTMQVLAVDYNYNYSLYLVPITLKNTSAAAGATVTAPKSAAAVAYTLKQEGAWTTPYNTLPGADASAPAGDAAPNGTGVFVEVRWCNADAAPFAFDIERSADGTTFAKIGTVAGGTNKDCSDNQLSRPFFYRDNSSDLTVGKTFTYRVVARGANSVASNTTQTTPLAQFLPKLLGPADEVTGVALSPTFVIGHPQLAIGADGAGYNLQLRDLFSGSGFNLPGTQGASSMAVFRVEEGTGATGNGVPAGQALVLTSGLATNSVFTDTAGVLNPAKPNLAPVNTAAHTVSLPLALFAAPLQPLRPYKWQMYGGYAYKYLPAEGNRVSAYSAYAWPSSALQPIPATRPLNQNFDFITGTQ
ncbi:Ig-like domain-containing protein [Deinococcus arenicola]|uniref:Carboxypeptidase regulatory-like domain-containing protein n=1 Tax=Deinococcus arenicola TaxID=2994950 RepID=A0ABU4DNT1_9DEIO|nr:Ig-like domain-containing protein [Deinococcus sp. ZS9-10]MDV6374095.1 carboxypeptidase regulatory-like domain-containing protein [Deinococcus sp. ZS9-10]